MTGLAPRHRALLEELRDTFQPDVSYDPAPLVAAIEAWLAEPDPEPRPHRQVEILVEMEADTLPDVDALLAILDGWLDGGLGSAAEHHQHRTDSGSICLVVTRDGDAATGDGYAAELARWKAARDADRNG